MDVQIEIEEQAVGINAGKVLPLLDSLQTKEYQKPMGNGTYIVFTLTYLLSRQWVCSQASLRLQTVFFCFVLFFTSRSKFQDRILSYHPLIAEKPAKLVMRIQMSCTSSVLM